MSFLWGALAVLAVGILVALVFDVDAREATKTLTWAALIGVPLLLWMVVAALLRLLPAQVRPRMVRGRRLSTAALRRVAEHAHHNGWMVSTPSTSVIVLKRKR